MTTADIGAARVHLIVDADDVEKGIAQAKNAFTGFGNAAERAFDQSSAGVRRATNRITDYLAGLKSVDGQLERNLRQLARLGADEAIIKQLAQSWREVRSEVDQANNAFEEASRINAAFNKNRIDLAQREISSLVGVNPAEAAEVARRRADAEAALLPLLQRQEAELQRQLQLANQIAVARQQAAAEESQRGFNATLGVNDVDPAAAARRRADAEAAIVPLLQQQERELQAQLQLSNQIASARQQAAAEEAQRRFNSQLGITDRSGDLGYLMQQRSVVASLTQQFQALDNTIDQAFAQNRQADAFIQQLRNMQEAAGRTHYEMLQLQAARLGISQQAAPLIQGIQAQNEAMGRGTLTAKQYAFAMRGLPAQITDIVVSLASGMPVYMVALQQGGQIKDMFGGIGPAVRAVSGAFLGMLNPLTLVAGGLGAVALGAVSAEGRLADFAKSTIVSGGFAGTAAELRDVADALDDINDISRKNADAAVQAIARGGVLVGENARLAEQATAAWATATGANVEEIARKFESLGKEPLDALMKLNETERFLTEAQYERIKALQDEGDFQGAVTEAVRIYFDTVNGRSQEVIENLGATRQAWLDIKDAIGEAWGGFTTFADGTVEGLRAIGNAQNIVIAGFANILTQSSGNGTVMDRIRGIGRGVYQQFYPEDFSGVTGSSRGGANGVALTREQQKALEDLDKQLSTSGSKTEQYGKALTRLNASLKNVSDEALRARNITRDADGNYSGTGYDSLVKTLQDRYKESATKLPSGRDATQMIRDQLAAELASLQTQQKATEISYQQRGISVEQYYDKLLEYATRERDLTLASNEAQIAALAGKRDAERQISTLRANSARAEESFAQRKMELDAGELRAIQQREAAYRDFARNLAARTEAVQRDMDTMVAAIGTSDRNIAIQQRINDIYREQTDALRSLNNQVDDGAISSEEAERRRQAVLAETTRSINGVIDGYSRLEVAQADGLMGAQRAWENWRDSVNDIAGQVGQGMTSALDGVSKATAQALTGNLGAYRDFWSQMHLMILEFIAKQKLTDWLSSLGNFAAGKGGDGFWSVIASALGGSGGGSTTGTLSTLFSGSWGFAQGGVPGGSGLSAYRNQIVSKPTYFAFAKGGVPNMGLMGERSGKPHEAIVPLTRTANGDLGVRMVDNGQRGPVTVQQTYIVQGTPDRWTREQLAAKNGRESARAISRNG